MASGLLAGLSFPPAEHGGLAWFAWAPWLALLARCNRMRDAALLGAFQSFALHAITLSWMVPVMHVHGGMPLSSSLACFGLALVILAPYSALAGALTQRACRRFGPAGLLVMVVVLPALDALRERFSLGFAWVLPGMSVVHQGAALSIAEWGGVHAVSALVLLGNVAVAAFLVLASEQDATRRGSSSALVLGLLAGAAVLALLIHGRGANARHAPRVAPAVRVTSQIEAASTDWKRGIMDEGASQQLARAWDGAPTDFVRVVLVQSAVPQQVVMRPSSRDESERARLQLRLTREALDGGADLVVWSESSYPMTLGEMPWLLDLVERFLVEAQRADRAPPEAILGALIETGDGRISNSSLLVSGRSVLGRYDKSHLVPFGEYLPFESVFFWFRRLVPDAIGDLAPGEGSVVLHGMHGSYGAFVCYEAILPQHVGAFAAEGADLLVNITNDGWFHGSSAPEQHLAFSILRAVETRRWVLRCANSGISAFVAPDGSVTGRLEEGERGLLAQSVERMDYETIYTRVGDAPLFGLAALVVLLLLPGRRFNEDGDRP